MQKSQPSRKIVPVLLLAVVTVGVALLIWPNKPSEPPPAVAVQGDASAGVTVPAEEPSQPNFKPLVGDWIREDGGYRLQISRAENDGHLIAAYFNPRPINVSHATATNDGSTLKVRVELNDTGYPGCVYSLAHDRGNDRLIGTYYQAAMGETYEVSFLRNQ